MTSPDGLNPGEAWLNDLVTTVSSTSDELAFYQRTAAGYDEIVKHLDVEAPDLCMKAICNFEQKTGVKIPRDGRVLDIGAGTGLSGAALKRNGFTGQVDALEPSTNMFQLAKPRKIYTEWFQELLLEDKETSIPSDCYDLAFSVSVFSDRSATSKCLPECIRILKPGGHLAIAMMKHFWARDFEDKVKHMEEENLARLVYDETLLEKYAKGHHGLVFILQKL